MRPRRCPNRGDSQDHAERRPLLNPTAPVRVVVIAVAALEREVSRQLGQEWQRDRPMARQALPLSRAGVVPTNLPCE
jgi:hypothetical protein